jgi:hypothetical protein
MSGGTGWLAERFAREAGAFFGFGSTSLQSGTRSDCFGGFCFPKAQSEIPRSARNDKREWARMDSRLRDGNDQGAGMTQHGFPFSRE